MSVKRDSTVSYNPASARLTIGLLMFNALIQLNGSGGSNVRDVASGIDRHPDETEIDFRLQIQGNRTLYPCSHTF